MIPLLLLLLSHLFLSACAYTVHTGFNYGAFWSTGANPKHKPDYVAAFRAAYALNTSVAFDSARLFTCRQPGTTDTWIEAFDAAVETHTYLLPVFYLSEVRPSARKPGQTYETNAQMLRYELRALEGALARYGNRLGDLIIGLSVGNEDMEQWYAGRETGVPEDVVAGNVGTVRGVVNGGSAFGDTYPAIAKYLKGKPIGHTDTVPHATKVKGVDFIGMNAYPYWSGDPPASMRDSYFGSLESTRKAMPGKDVWLTEVGWPFKDTTSSKAGLGVANRENLQKYWNDVGCGLFGLYTLFWFELVQDTLSDQPDWAILDSVERDIPRIDVSCGKGRSGWAHRRDISGREVSTSQLPETASPKESASKPPSRSTKHVTVTTTVTKVSPPGYSTSLGQPANITTKYSSTVNAACPAPPLPPSNSSIATPGPPNNSTAPPLPTVPVTSPAGCITISFDSAGQRITLSNPPVNGACPTPTYAPPSHANLTAPAPTTAVLSSIHTAPANTQITNHTTTPPPSTLAPNATVTIIEATGCIMVSPDGHGAFVTVASSPPTNGTCVAPTYEPSRSSKVTKTVIVSPSPVTEAESQVSGTVTAAVSG